MSKHVAKSLWRPAVTALLAWCVFVVKDSGTLTIAQTSSNGPSIAVDVEHNATNTLDGPSWQTTWTVVGTNGQTNVVSSSFTPSPPAAMGMMSLAESNEWLEGRMSMRGYYSDPPPACGDSENPDTDHDGLPDSVEHDIGTDSDIPDWDNDGYTDLQETVFGTDPYDAASHPPIPPHLIGWWRFDERSGSTAEDSSGNLQTGVLLDDPGPVWVTNKLTIGALDFDGANSYVALPGTAAFCGLSTQITVSAWIYPRSQSTECAPIVKTSGDDDTCGFSLEYTGATNVLFWLYTGEGTDWIASPSATIPTGQWTHVVATFNGTTIRLYTNGISVGTPTAFTGSVTVCASEMAIGHDLHNYDRYYKGWIDDVRIYSTALSTGEVAAVYHMDTDFDGLGNIDEIRTHGTDPNLFDTDGDGYNDGQELFFGANPLNSASHPAIPDHLLGWWHFDEGSGTNTADSSGNVQGGLLKGSPNPSWVTNSVAGYALTYDGTNGYVTTPGSTLSAITTQLTVSAWIKPGHQSSGSPPILRWYTSTDTCGFTMEFTATSNVMFWAYTSSLQDWIPTPSVTVPTNQWSHVAVTYNGAALRLYFNGAQVGSAVTFTDAVTICGTVLTIGHDLHNADRYYTGSIDEARVYDRALASNEVAAAYALDTIHDGIPGWWRQYYFGNSTTTNSSSCASCDPDGDWISNLQEYRYGTAPLTTNALDVVVNGSNRWTTNVTVSLDPLSNPYPFIAVSLRPWMTNVTIVANPGHSFGAAMPNTNNADQVLFFQYLTDSTNPVGAVMAKVLTVDSIPPRVTIISPTNAATDQAFVRLRATVYDPDPENTNTPSNLRPIKVWINGTRYWNKHGTEIDIPRFPVRLNTNNVIDIVVEDAVSNRTEATASFTSNPSTDTNAPTFSITSFLTNVVAVLPDISEVWMSGQIVDLNAIMTASVNGGGPITMNVRSNQFGYLLPLAWGTNTVVVRASDAAGNATSNIYTLVRSDRYRLAVTSPEFGSFLNSSNVTVTGYVSALKDEGLPTQTNIASVTVNGVGTTLGGTDGEGNRSFTTTNALAVPSDGSSFTLHVVAHWANGTDDPEVQVEPYFVIERQYTASFYEIGHDFYAGCHAPDPSTLGQEHDSFSFILPGSGGNSLEIYNRLFEWWDCSGSYDNDIGASTNQTNVSQPPTGLKFGNELTVENDLCVVECGPGSGSLLQEYTWEGQITVKAPSSFPTNGVAVFAFDEVDYSRKSGVSLDLSQVTFQGHIPLVSNGASYLVTFGAGQSFSIDGSSFGWPGGYSNMSTGRPLPDLEVSTTIADWFKFGGFGVSPINIQVSPNGFTACPYSTNTFSASGAPGDLSYTWDLAGCSGCNIISNWGSHSENASIEFTDSACGQTITAKVTFDGVTVSGSATGTVAHIISNTASIDFLDPDGVHGNPEVTNCSFSVATISAEIRFCAVRSAPILLTVEVTSPGPLASNACLVAFDDGGFIPDGVRMSRIVGSYDPSSPVYGAEKIVGQAGYMCTGVEEYDFCSGTNYTGGTFPCPNNGKWACIGWKVTPSDCGSATVTLVPQQMAPVCPTSAERICIPPD